MMYLKPVFNEDDPKKIAFPITKYLGKHAKIMNELLKQRPPRHKNLVRTAGFTPERLYQYILRKMLPSIHQRDKSDHNPQRRGSAAHAFKSTTNNFV